MLEGVGGPAGPGSGGILTRHPSCSGGVRGHPSQVVGWGLGAGWAAGVGPHQWGLVEWDSPTTSAMAAPAEQQLSLVAELVGSGLQGSLFAEAAPAAAAAASRAPGGRSRFAAPDASGDDSEALDADHLLEADAASRPRPRRDTASRARGLEGEEGSDGGATAASTKAAAGAARAITKPAAETAVAEAQAEGSASSAAAPVVSAHTAEELHPQPDADLPRWHHHSLVDPASLSPVLRHYVELKAAHPERVLLYRLGDFYEFFFEDALLLSRLLELTLTGKEGGKGIGRVPMAGIPHHAAERYCAELVRRGLSVALCDQLETTPAKGALLRRDITRVLTPGTVLEEGMLAARRNNWLCAVVLGPSGRWGLAVADVSTGEFRVTEREGSGARSCCNWRRPRWCGLGWKRAW